MRSLVLAIVLLSVSVATWATDAGRYDFPCDGIKSLIALLQKNPDALFKDITDDSESYSNDTIPGWQCTTVPFPPLSHGRLFLQGLGCVLSNDVSAVDDDALEASGESFKDGLSSYFECFGRDLEVVSPTTYIKELRGEEMVGLIRTTANSHKIIVNYGYRWDTHDQHRIVWRVGVAYAK